MDTYLLTMIEKTHAYSVQSVQISRTQKTRTELSKWFIYEYVLYE